MNVEPLVMQDPPSFLKLECINANANECDGCKIWGKAGRHWKMGIISLLPSPALNVNLFLFIHQLYKKNCVTKGYVISNLLPRVKRSSQKKSLIVYFKLHLEIYPHL